MNVSRASLNLFKAGNLPYDPVKLAPLLIDDLISLYKQRDIAEKVDDVPFVEAPIRPLTTEQVVKQLESTHHVVIDTVPAVQPEPSGKEWWGTFNGNHKYDECYVIIQAADRAEAESKMDTRFGLGQWDKLHESEEAAGVKTKFLARLR